MLCFITGVPCDSYLVSGQDPVSDSALSASSSFDDLHAVRNARLHKLPTSLGRGAWSALINDQKPFIQVSKIYKNIRRKILWYFDNCMSLFTLNFY